VSERIATVQDLVAAREARGLAPEDVMRQLKLHPKQLRALEAGEWAALPGQAFVRGVLRGYGRMLDVDVEPLVESMSATVHAADLRPAASLDQPLPSRSMLGFGSGGSGSRVAWIVLLAAGVLVLAIFFGGSDLGGVGSWLSRDRAAEVPAEQSEAQQPATEQGAPGTTTETVTLAPLAPARSDASTAASPPDAAQAASAAQAGQAGAVAGVAAPSASPSPAQPPAPQADAASAGAAATGKSLRLVFEREAWLEAKRDGKVLVSGTQPAGSMRELSIEGPTVLVIGNASGVRAEFGGQPFDLAPHVRGSVARLTLP
jgi:cytoskeleton protein RodZ